jgi:peptidoglycan hydrolase CwlO-like protein
MENTTIYDMDSPQSQVDKLLGDKNRIEKQIEQIQSECSHTSKSLKQNQSEIRWYCDECKQALGYASKDEIDNFLTPE